MTLNLKNGNISCKSCGFVSLSCYITQENEHRVFDDEEG